jgi:hypothetical protein
MSIFKKNFRAFSSILLLLPIASCSSKKQKKLSGELYTSSPFDCDERSLLRAQLIQKDASRGDFFTVEGKLFDIPLPMGAYPSQVVQSNVTVPDDQSLFFYETSESILSLNTFFREQMEVFGWIFETAFVGQEYLMLFRKGTKRCIISLRVNPRKAKNSSLIVLGIG